MLIYRIENEIDDQEAHLRIITPSRNTRKNFVTPSHDLKVTAGQTSSNYSLSIVT